MIKDGLGIWTGKRQFRIKLEGDPNSEDGLQHPPAVFSIGADRGFLVYAGQPLCCRKCGGKGHDIEHCDQVRCRNCNSVGHNTRACTEPKRCHLCESETHMARDCMKPRPYTAVVKGFLEQDKGDGYETARAPVMTPELPAGEENETDEREEEVEKPEEALPQEVEERNKDEERGRSEDKESSEEPWKVVRKAKRKSTKRRRRLDLTTPPENGYEKEIGAEPSVWEVEGYAPKGTQTECIHTPLSALMSDSETEEENETEGKLEKSFIRSLFSQENRLLHE
ncbi:hepcidin [Sarotherodon galilaeus]